MLYSYEAEELSKKFMEQNIELQHEIETFRSKLDYIVTYINQKLDQQKTTTTTTLSSLSIHQLVFETMQQTEMKLLEFKLKFISQQEENDLLKYLFDNSDEGIKFHMENLKLKCDVLHKHILTCSQRLGDINKQNLMKLTNKNQILKIRTQHEESNIDNKNIELEFELLRLRERYSELIEHTNTLKSELNNAQKQLHEQEKIEPNLNVDLEKERRRADEFENDYKSLKIKYDDVCERIRIATHQLEHVQIVLEETSRRCEQLEKEKSEINAQSEYLSQNVFNVTSKYKDKLNTIKVRLEQAERERREVQLLTKIFDIKIIPSDHSLSDEYENRYLYELQQERKELMRKMQNENEQMQQKLSESMRRSTIDSLVQENPTNYTYSNSQIQTNVLRCAHCFAPKSNDLYTRFCTECGLS
ncbi:unnamed protein product [Rotaria sp. Silwood1]|nr:unnamed protein product [Rotaria sp. Silwood1]CAF1664972.1 unnamed protein product [Rotaria sp. Silwood1]